MTPFLRSCRLVLLRLAPLGLVACAGTPTGSAPPLQAPAQWQTNLPHQGQLSDLSRWWQQFEDPVLLNLMAQAQAVSPSLAAAKSRIEQARASRVAAAGAGQPAVNASAGVSRQNDILNTQGVAATTVQTAVQASWEIDLFGGIRASSQAANARLESAQAQWHDARVSVAAETAGQYFDYRHCIEQLAVVTADADSRLETARLTELAARAGLQAPAAAAMARAGAAQGNSLRVQQKSQCDQHVKALVALTAIDEAGLRQQLSDGRRASTAGAEVQLTIDSLPARVLAQRPDIWSAQQELIAAGADIDAAQARRYPQLTLGGSLGYERFRGGGNDVDAGSWSVGPVTVSVPLFDAGVRQANIGSARARYDEALTSYRARLRTAVREVEEALLALHSTGLRLQDAAVAAAGFRASLQASEVRWRAGLGNLFELEDSRRSALAAQQALLGLQRERLGAWIALYRAAGGGWSAASGNATPVPNTPEQRGT